MFDQLLSIISFIKPIHLWIVFILVFIYTIVMSAILLFHWYHFSTQNKYVKIASGLYFTVLAIIIFSLAVIINFIT